MATRIERTRLKTLRRGVTPAGIEQIENLPLKPIEKFDLLLTYLGIKPACWIGLRSGEWKDDEPEQTVDVYQLEAVRRCLQRLHMAFEEREEGIKTIGGGYQVRVSFAVSLKPATAKYLRLRLDEKNHIGIGLLLGYPITAVMAFSQPHMVAMGRITEVQMGDFDPKAIKAFARYSFSTNEIDAEIRHLAGWIEICGAYSIRIWNEVYSAAEKAAEAVLQ